MSYVRGQVLTRSGRLIASFTQDGMIRPIDASGAAVSTRSRL
jgi:acyl-CoA thioesterase